MTTYIVDVIWPTWQALTTYVYIIPTWIPGYKTDEYEDESYIILYICIKTRVYERAEGKSGSEIKKKKYQKKKKKNEREIVIKTGLSDVTRSGETWEEKRKIRCRKSPWSKWHVDFFSKTRKTDNTKVYMGIRIVYMYVSIYIYTCI